MAKEKKLKCPSCDKHFVNNQGLSVHIKCVHPNAEPKETEPELHGQDNSLLFQENSFPSASQTDNPCTSRATSASASDAVTATSEPTEKNGRRGQDKRRKYSVEEKAEIIFEVESGQKRDQVGC